MHNHNVVYESIEMLYVTMHSILFYDRGISHISIPNSHTKGLELGLVALNTKQPKRSDL